ncbi:magnesium transporter [Methylomonas methanica]|uniref:Magnesium transporter MgtE n=1 Tax=Methylomonas methanica (strain DSM 25384 / MC09) TaxID=857087 RepID=G0A4Y8_METMM|nr:magnesium transporter [Methylomonas methanica]AEF99151.1 magnesium transporter [Methylomonas methanica MC09]
MSSLPIENSKQLLNRVGKILEKGSQIEIRNLVHSLYPAETAHILESLEPEQRAKIWTVIPPSVMGEILVEVNEEVGSGLLKITDRKDLIAACENMGSDSMVDLLHVLPEPLLSQVIETIGAQNRSRFEKTLRYAEHTAGGLMSQEVLTVRSDVTLDVVARYLRKRGKIPAGTESLVVVDRTEQFQGVLPLSQFLASDPHSKVADVMDSRGIAVIYSMPSRDVVRLFEQRNLLSMPVVADDGKVIGRITIDDIVDVIREEADHSLMGMAGLTEEHDMFAPVVTSAKRRAVWLGINLLTAFLAAWVIDLFEDTIQQIVALAVLMPIVASMGGIAGSQTLTLVIRGLALQQVSAGNTLSLLIKEVSVGLANGIFWSIVVTCVAGIWFHDSHLGILLGSAMLINLVCAALAGVTIPVVLDRLGIDPALAGGVLLTTVTDVVGFMAFLGLATLFLL